MRPLLSGFLEGWSKQARTAKMTQLFGHLGCTDYRSVLET